MTNMFVIIPTGAKDGAMLRHCLDTLRRAADGITLRIVIVLCPSDSAKIDTVRSVMDGTEELITLPAPFSFARSNNAALDRLRDESAILLLNDDCFFRKKSDLRRLTDMMSRKHLACIGPRIHNLAFAGELPRERRAWFGVTRSPFPLVGACLLIDRAWLDTIGRFDEDFSGYGMEEADLLYRMLEKGGRWARYDRVQVDHLHHATVGGTIKEEEPHLRNLARWAEKYPGVHSWGGSAQWHRNLQTQRNHSI